MDILEATREYEAWLGGKLELLPSDIKRKHREMATDSFAFFRATFYRWAQVWPDACAKLAGAPAVPSVGDLHVENFGTWRDPEGRLIWGINDFDEAAVLPYTQDLVRLAASALVAFEEGELLLKPMAACAVIMDGYHQCLKSGGLPFVLAEKHDALRRMAQIALGDPEQYWNRLDGLMTVDSVPEKVIHALESDVPAHADRKRIVHRVSGLGSLGRQRFAMLAVWCGGKVCREAKPLTTSAWSWARGAGSGSGILYRKLLDGAVRASDATVRLKGSWIVRRLAPDCARIELSGLPAKRDERVLIHAMGWETGNIHLGDRAAAEAILADLKARPPTWLYKAADTMLKMTIQDWKQWRSARKKRQGARN